MFPLILTVLNRDYSTPDVRITFWIRAQEAFVRAPTLASHLLDGQSATALAGGTPTL